MGQSTRPSVGLGDPDRCFLIAEVGQAHDGSLGNAHAYIDAIADAGADAVKFQTHIAAAESTPDEPWRVKFSYQDATRYEYWQRMEFTKQQWAGLATHAADRGLVFLSSPFSVEAVELLEDIGVPGWKLASGEVSNIPMLERIADTGKPVLASTGMSSMSEVETLVNWSRERDLQLSLFQCTSAYPCPPERVGLNLLAEYRDRFGVAVGLSDHSGTIFPGLAAATLGADMLEVHVTMHRKAFGPDVPASLTLEELRQLADGAAYIRKATAHPVDKDQAVASMSEMRSLFTKSLVARNDLAPGHTIAREDLTTKKPGTGIAASEFHSVVGRTVVRSVAKGSFLAREDLS